MATIKVHLLNFHFIWSRIGIVLEDTSTNPPLFYGLARWEEPKRRWSRHPECFIAQASSVYSFDIDASPAEIINEWTAYWRDTHDEMSMIGNNCAVSTQWFLTKFAAIPEPDLSNVSFNHFFLGVVWPSFIPCPVTLPGRVMANARFHIEAREHPENAERYSRLFLYSSIALAIVVFSTSLFALLLAAEVLKGAIAVVSIVTCVTTSMLSTYGFFCAVNLLSAKHIAEIRQINKPEPVNSLLNLFDPSSLELNSPRA